MAISTTTPKGQDEPNILTMNLNMDTPAARRALHAGLLEAKTQAQAKARRLAAIGTPLLLAVIGVSFVHLWESVSVYKPEYVPALALPANIHYLTAGAFTLGIDAVAFYVIAAQNAAALAGAKPSRGQRWSTRFFLLLTFMLNAAFIIRHAPALPSSFVGFAMPALDFFNIVALPAFVPISIIAVERAAHVAETTKLKLLVETTVLNELLGNNKQQPINASGSINGLQPANEDKPANDTAPATGGRRQTYTLPDLRAGLFDQLTGREIVSRAELMQVVGCGESTIDKLIKQAVDAQMLQKLGNGNYKVL